MVVVATCGSTRSAFASGLARVGPCATPSRVPPLRAKARLSSQSEQQGSQYPTTNVITVEEEGPSSSASTAPTAGSSSPSAFAAWAERKARDPAGRSSGKAALPLSEYVPEDVVKEFEVKLQGDLQSVAATLVAGIGVITWWRGVWALLDHYIGDSVFGHCMCVVTGLMIILYIRFSGYRLTNFFPPS